MQFGIFIMIFGKVSVVYTWYDKAEQVETNGANSHMSIHEYGQYAHAIE